VKTCNHGHFCQAFLLIFTHSRYTPSLDYMRAVQSSGRIPFGVPHHKLAAIFMQFVIFQDYVPSYKQEVINACLDLTSYSPENNLQYLGVLNSQVLVHVAGIQIVLVDLQEAALRPDLFPAIVTLKQVAKRDFSPPPQVNTKTSPSTALAVKPSTAVVVTPALKPPANPSKSTKSCPNGSKCGHVLDGTCGFFHTKQEIAEAGAIVEERIAIPPCKVEWLVGTHGILLKIMAEDCGANIDVMPEEQYKMCIVRLVGTRLAVGKGVELIMDRAKRYKKEVGHEENQNDTTEEKAESEERELEASSTTTSDTVPSDENPIQPTEKEEETAIVPYVAAVTNAGVSPPADLEDDTAWPSLQSEKADVTTSQRATSKPVLEYAAKAAMPPKNIPAAKAAPSKPSKKQGTSNGSVAKVDYKHPCIHGKNCKFLQSGRDECKFFHSTAEIEQAAARFMEDKVYLSPAVVAWVIGKGASRLKALEQESGANLYVDQKGVRRGENRVVYITGKQKCVNAAVSILKKLVPATQNVETRPDVSSVVAPVAQSDPAPITETVSPADSNPVTKVERELYLSPDVVGWIVGKNGSQMNAVCEASEANVLIEPKGNNTNENRLVRITGKEVSVNTAIEMIKGLLPEGYGIETGPGISSVEAQTEEIAPIEKENAPVEKVNTMKNYAPVAEKKAPARKTAPSSKAARAAQKKSRNVEHVLYVSPAVVGWIIGKDGKRLKERINECGADINIDSDSMRLNESKIVYLTGPQKSVDAAIEMVKEQLPSGYNFESGPGVPSNGASTVSSSPQSKASTHPGVNETDAVVNPAYLGPSPPPGFIQPVTNLISPPRPIRQLPFAQRVESAAFLTSDVSVYSGSGNLLSDMTTNGYTSPVDFSHNYHEGYNDKYVVTGETIPTSASSGSNLQLSALTYCIPTVDAPVAPTCTDPLLGFLMGQADCLKGSPDAFHTWLLSEDITSLVDLGEAVADDEYFHDVLQKGNGKIGVKGFKRNAFKKAVVDAQYSSTF